MRLYVDGVEVASKLNWTWAAFVIDSHMRFGKSNRNNNRLFAGAADEIAVFPRALSADEIQSQYRAAVEEATQDADLGVSSERSTNPAEANMRKQP